MYYILLWGELFSLHASIFFILVGDRLDDVELEEILKFTHTEEDLDGNIKYGGKTNENFLINQTENMALDLYVSFINNKYMPAATHKKIVVAICIVEVRYQSTANSKPTFLLSYIIFLQCHWQCFVCSFRIYRQNYGWSRRISYNQFSDPVQDIDTP